MSFILERFHRDAHKDTNESNDNKQPNDSKTSSDSKRKQTAASWSARRFHYMLVYLTTHGTVRMVHLVLEKDRALHVADRTTKIPQFEGRPVESIWPFTLPNHRSIPKHLRSACWVHGVKYGVQLWSPSLDTLRTTPDSYDYDRMPLGPSSTIGLFLSVSTDPFVSEIATNEGEHDAHKVDNSNEIQHRTRSMGRAQPADEQPGMADTTIESSVCYELRTLSRPCIHDVIRCLLEMGMHDEATDTTQYCHRMYPDFVKLGELLVREALERTYDDRRSMEDKSTSNSDTIASTHSNSGSNSSSNSMLSSSSSVLLQRILLLLRSFSGYEDIVMRCGRRAERSRWPLLFPLAGQPTDLFERAVKCGKYRVASSLLVIMDNIEDAMLEEGVTSLSSMSSKSSIDENNERSETMRGMLPTRISEKKSMESSYENTMHVVLCGQRLIGMVEEKRGPADPLIANLNRYLERLELKGKELLSSLRNLD
jgi:hypothetical protein